MITTTSSRFGPASQSSAADSIITRSSVTEDFYESKLTVSLTFFNHNFKKLLCQLFKSFIHIKSVIIFLHVMHYLVIIYKTKSNLIIVFIQRLHDLKVSEVTYYLASNFITRTYNQVKKGHHIGGSII